MRCKTLLGDFIDYAPPRCNAIHLNFFGPQTCRRRLYKKFRYHSLHPPWRSHLMSVETEVGHSRTVHELARDLSEKFPVILLAPTTNRKIIDQLERCRKVDAWI